MIFKHITYFLMLFLFGHTLFAEELGQPLLQIQEKIALGYLKDAHSQLQQLANTENQDAYTVTAIKGLQGYLDLQRQNYQEAEPRLNSSLEQAQKNSWFDLIAHFALYLGQLNEQQQNLIKAQENYQQAIGAAEKSGDKSLIISSFLSLAKLAIVNKKFDKAWNYLLQGKKELQSLEANNPFVSQLWLSLGYQTLQLYLQNPTQKYYLSGAYDSLQQALFRAKQSKQFTTQALSLSYLAELYDKQQRPQEAINLLLGAIKVVENKQVPDVLFDLKWQLAKLYKTQNNQPAALHVYRQAVNHLEEIRLDIPINYPQGESSLELFF